MTAYLLAGSALTWFSAVQARKIGAVPFVEALIVFVVASGVWLPWLFKIARDHGGIRAVVNQLKSQTETVAS